MDRATPRITIRRMILTSAALLACVFAVDRSALAAVKATPTPVEEVLDVPSQSDVQRLLWKNDWRGAAELLGKIRAAARARGDWDAWFAALQQETKYLLDPVFAGPKPIPGEYSRDRAIRVVSDEPDPPRPELQVARLLLLAQLHAAAAEVGGGNSGSPTPQERRAHVLASQAALAKAFSLRAAVGSSDRRAIKVEAWGSPARPTARDVVTYRFAASLFHWVLCEGETAGLAAGRDVRTLLGPVPERSVSDPNPLVRIAAILDDLERWHTSQHRREAALEALLERHRILYQVFASAAADRLITEDLRQRLPAYRDVPWWAMGMAQLALFLNERSPVPETPLRVAEAGAQAYPNSEGGKRCATIARILRFEIDDPELSIAAPKTSSVDAPELIATHRGAAVVYLRAWPRPIEDVTEDRWPNLAAATAGYRREKLPPPAGTPVTWTATLPAPADRRPLQSPVIAPLHARGLYRVEASLSPEFAADSTASLLLLVSDLTLAVAVDVDAVRVRALSIATGCPLPGVRVRLLERRGGKEPRSVELAAATTGADGHAAFPRPDGTAPFAVVGVHGEDVAHATLYVRPEPPGYSQYGAPPSRTARLLLDRQTAAPGDRVSWWAAVRDGGAPGHGITPAGGLSYALAVLDGAGHQRADARGATDAFGTASGEFVLPPLPDGDANWKVVLRAASAGAQAAPLASSGVGLVPTAPLAISFGPILGFAAGHTARTSGAVTGADGRPVSGAAVEWEILGQADRELPPRIAAPRFPAPVPVAQGHLHTGADGRFTVDTALPGRQPATGAGSSYSFHVTASDGHGHTAAAAAAATGFSGPLDLLLEGPQLLAAGEKTVWRVARRNRMDGVTAAGESTITVIRVPTLGEVPLLEFPRQGPDYNAPYQAGTKSVSTEALLDAVRDGEVVATVTLRHDVSGRAWLDLPELRPGLYRVRAESRYGNGAARASRYLVVVGPGLQLPLPLGLLVDDRTAGTRRILVSAGPESGNVILELYCYGHLLDTRTIASPATELVEIPRSYTDPLAVRALTVARGRVLTLDTTVGRAGGPLVVAIESLEPELRARVSTTEGTPVRDAEVTIVGFDSSRYPYELDCRSYDATSTPSLVVSGNTFGTGTALRPPSAKEWAATSLPALPDNEGGRVGRQVNVCGTGMLPAGRPSLPLPSNYDPTAVWRTEERRWSQPLPRTGLVVWAPRLTTDAGGRVRAPAVRAPAGASLRIAVSALTQDGRAGFIETVVGPGAPVSAGAPSPEKREGRR